MLVAAGLTPAVLLSLKANATRIPANVNLDAHMDDFINRRPELGETGGKAWSANQIKTFKLAGGALWSVARYAMGADNAVFVPFEPDEEQIAITAIELSGPALSEKFGKFDERGYDPDTMGCAGMLGYLSRHGALIGGGKITPLVYTAAFWQVKAYIDRATKGAGGLAC